MRSWKHSIPGLVLACLLAVPAAASAADAVLGGRGPRIQAHGHPPVSTHGRPVFVAVDELAAFGDLDLAAAPPLLIRVEGDVDVVVLPDGSLRFVLGREDEEAAE